MGKLDLNRTARIQKLCENILSVYTKIVVIFILENYCLKTILYVEKSSVQFSHISLAF